MAMLHRACHFGDSRPSRSNWMAKSCRRQSRPARQLVAKPARLDAMENVTP